MEALVFALRHFLAVFCSSREVRGALFMIRRLLPIAVELIDWCRAAIEQEKWAHLRGILQIHLSRSCEKYGPCADINTPLPKWSLVNASSL